MQSCIPSYVLAEGLTPLSVLIIDSWLGLLYNIKAFVMVEFFYASLGIAV